MLWRIKKDTDICPRPFDKTIYLLRADLQQDRFEFLLEGAERLGT